MCVCVCVCVCVNMCVGEWLNRPLSLCLPDTVTAHLAQSAMVNSGVSI